VVAQNSSLDGSGFCSDECEAGAYSNDNWHNAVDWNDMKNNQTLDIP